MTERFPHLERVDNAERPADKCRRAFTFSKGYSAVQSPQKGSIV